MDDRKRGDDAADHAPRPQAQSKDKPEPRAGQDAPNYDKRTDDGRAIDDEDLNSANDE